MQRTQKRASIVTIALLASACTETAMSPSADPAGLTRRSTIVATGTSVVTEATVVRQDENTLPTGSWVLYTRPTADVESGDFVVGPNTAPLGIGSFRTVTATGGSKVWLFNYDHIGTSLADIASIGYSTWKAPGVTAVAFPSLNIQVDINGGSLNTGEFRTFVFEPYVQPGFVDATGVWQTRDAFNGGAGRWWSTGASSCPQSTPCAWTDLIAQFPGATIVGGFGINQGSGNPETDGASDALILGYGGNTITYDFEPWLAATTKDACKQGGWMTVRRADGSPFKNQGDCVSYVNTGK